MYSLLCRTTWFTQRAPAFWSVMLVAGASFRAFVALGLPPCLQDLGRAWLESPHNGSFILVLVQQRKVPMAKIMT